MDCKLFGPPGAVHGAAQWLNYVAGQPCPARMSLDRAHPVEAPGQGGGLAVDKL